MKHAVKRCMGVILFITAIVMTSRGQQILFRNYTVGDGLCSNTVWAISQDEQGYMWFGTKDGLNRFDGYEFESYRFDKNDPASIGDRWITVILNDNADSCWIGTEKGVYILDLSHETFHFFAELGRKSVFDIKKDDSGNIWIATSTGVFRYDTRNGRLRRFLHQRGDKNTISSNFVRKILLDDAGNVWIGTSQHGIDVYDPGADTFRHYAAGRDAGNLSSNFITDLYKDKAGNIWIGTEKGGMDLWVKEADTFKVYKHGGANSISDNIVRDIFQPRPGVLYIGTEKGLDILDMASGKFSNYDHRANDPYSLGDNAVYAIFQDKMGGIWIGTYFGGVSYFYPNYTNFELYYPTGAETSVSGRAVSALLQDDAAHIWVGTEDGGLNYFDTQTKSFKHYPFKPGQEKLSYHNIHALMKDRQGNIWIGTFTGGINVYHPRTGRVNVYKFGDGSDASSYRNMIYDLYLDKSGTIWVGTVGGLFRYDASGKRFLRITKAGIQRAWIYDIYEDSNGSLWFGTYNLGLYQKNTNTGQWHHYKIGGVSDSLVSEKIICITEAAGDRLWLGTDGGGLYLFDVKTGKAVSEKGRYGLDADIIFGMLKDKENHLWLSTNNGLFDLDPLHKTSRHYTQWDHLQGKQFNYKSYLKTTDGKFYFGGVNGLNAFYPDSIHLLKPDTRVTFTGFKLFNKDVPLNAGKSPLHKTITYTRHVTLSHKQSVFSIEYAALNYMAPYKTRYAYKMEGYDQNWNDVNGQRKATYTNLPAGNYVFKVKATDINGHWSPRIAELNITIRPPFYKTIPAYVLYALIVAGIVLFFRKKEINRIRKRNQIRMEREQNKKEEEFYKQKIDFFTSMAHEIRTPLSLIIAPLEKLIRAGHWDPDVKQQLEVMDENSSRLLTLTNQLLDFRKMESDLYEIRPERIEIVSLIHTLFSRFSSISYQKGIKFSITAKISSLEAEADPEALTKILSNLLINAFKFTRSRVEIIINEPVEKQGQQFFSVSIEDDGIGIPPEDIGHVFEKFYQVSSGKYEYNNLGGNGIGLALAKTLTEKHHGFLLVESRQNVKTAFTVLIPFVPLAADAGNDTGEIEPVDHKTGGENRQSVLIVEDDPSLLEFICKNMKDSGYRPFGARNGKEALDVLEKNSIDLILSDVMMPEMDGLEFCRQVKENMNFSHIPLVLLTARANLEVEIEGIERGADAYITKPFKWKHVLAVVNNLVESRVKLKQKFSRQPFSEPGSLVINQGDRKFLDQVIAIIHQQIDDSRLSVEVLSNEMAMSRSSLHKKLKAISGHVPNEFIRLIRLKRAARLLLQNEYNISEISYMTGFNSPSYFSKCFYRQFKMTPREFQENQKQKNPSGE